MTAEGEEEREGEKERALVLQVERAELRLPSVMPHFPWRKAGREVEEGDGGGQEQ